MPNAPVAAAATGLPETNYAAAQLPTRKLGKLSKVDLHHLATARAAAAGEPKLDDLEVIFIETWSRQDERERTMTMDLLRWFDAGQPPESDPRRNWPQDVQERLRAANLI